MSYIPIKNNGFIYYNDSTTSSTPITVTANTWTDITNDGAGAFTNKNYKPFGVSELMETSTGYFDFTELELGDTVFIRNDFTITPSINNPKVEFRYVLGASGSQYPLESSLTSLRSGSGIQYRNSLRVDEIYIGDTNIKNNPAKLQIKLDSDATLVNAGTVLSVVKLDIK